MALFPCNRFPWKYYIHCATALNFKNKLEVALLLQMVCCLCSTPTSHQRVTNTLRTSLPYSFFCSSRSEAAESSIFGMKRPEKGIEMANSDHAVARSDDTVAFSWHTG